MDTKQKDNFTDVLDHLSSNDSSANSDSSAGSGQVVGADGQVVTLGNKDGQNTSMDN